MNWFDEMLFKLQAAPPHVNPAIALAVEAQCAESRGDTQFIDRAEASGEVRRCVRAGQAEGEAVSRALGTLNGAISVSSSTSPEGFGA